MSSIATSRRVRRIAGAAGLSAALLGTGVCAAGTANAATPVHRTPAQEQVKRSASGNCYQYGDKVVIPPGKTCTFNTWFFGSTDFELYDMGPGEASYAWDSGPSHDAGSAFWDRAQVRRAFWGFDFVLRNISQQASIGVTQEHN